jgi:hypothetical protein
MTGTLLQFDESHIVAHDARGKPGRFGQRDHRMPEPLARHPVEQIDESVLESAGIETEHHVRDQRSIWLHRSTPIDVRNER